MRHLHEEIQQHVHDDLCSEVNEMIINIKIHGVDISEESAEQQAKIIEARRRKPHPTWGEMIDLLSRVRNEMNDCKIPFRRR